MARGPEWTPTEDAIIATGAGQTAADAAAKMTGRSPGSAHPKGRARRLQAVADRFGRTLEAVRKRAQRIGERSYRPSRTRAPEAAREFYDMDDLSTVNRFYGARKGAIDDR